MSLFRDYEWPLPHEPVDTFWKEALQQGNAKILARYLREAEVDPLVLKYMAALLDRPRCGWRLQFTRGGLSIEGLTPGQIADLLAPASGTPRLMFKRPNRGHPPDPNQLFQDAGRNMLIRFARLHEGGKTYLAVESVQKTTGACRATLYRALRAAKQNRDPNRGDSANVALAGERL
jgi:hypothetical protein